MDYKFPLIGSLNDVLPAIKDRPEIGVMDRGPFIVVNYHYATADTFTGPNEAILRECRGLVFDGKTKTLLSRRFHKFFNLGERPDTQLEAINWWGKDHVVMDKLDGSMVSPVPVYNDLNNLRWTTKMGITDVAAQAESFAKTQPNLIKMCKTWISQGYTPIFEWTSPDNRIVLDYSEPRLTLIGMRNTTTGVYLSPSAMEDCCRPLGIPCVSFKKSLDLPGIKSETGVEGYVVRFNDGHMVKIKTDWYVKIHKAKEFISRDDLIIQAAIDGTVDDVLAVLPAEDKTRVEQLCKDFWNKIEKVTAITNAARDFAVKNHTRKDYAIHYAPHVQQRWAIFKTWDNGEDCRDFIIAAVKKDIARGSFTGIEDIRP